MRELATFAFTFLGFALLHAAKVERRPPGLAGSAAGYRTLACLAFALALGPLWSEGGAAVALVVVTGSMVAAMVFIVARPLAPRVSWALALVSGPLGGILWWSGR